MLFSPWLSSFAKHSWAQWSALSGPPRRRRSLSSRCDSFVSAVESLEPRTVLSAADDYLSTMGTLQGLADAAIVDAQ